MAEEIVRKLVNGQWVTTVENQGGGGGSLPDGWTTNDPAPGFLSAGGGVLLGLNAVESQIFSAAPESGGDEVFDAAGGSIGNLADPGDAQDAATKAYVDAQSGSQPGTLIVASELAGSVPTMTATSVPLDGMEHEVLFTVQEENLQPWIDVDGNIIKPGLFTLVAAISVTTPPTTPAPEVVWTGPGVLATVFPLTGSIFTTKLSEVFSLAAANLPYPLTTYITTPIDATGVISVDSVVYPLALATE